jgi:hypothetical protein
MKNKIFCFLAGMLAFTLVHAQQQPVKPAASDPTQMNQPAATVRQNSAEPLHDGNAYKNSPLTYNIIETPNNTFGYDVLVQGRLMIHQTSIPGMSGNNGFKTKEDAAKVAEIVMKKISNGEMPPTVDEDELKELSIIK